mgnify:CR=1 FL=1
MLPLLLVVWLSPARVRRSLARVVTMTWILILWVTGHQLAVYGYTREDCVDAAQLSNSGMGRKTSNALAYCIPAPKEIDR